ncbi:hypothetical protein SCALM49S_05528 [Streptomyces californicus]
MIFLRATVRGAARSNPYRVTCRSDRREHGDRSERGPRDRGSREGPAGRRAPPSTRGFDDTLVPEERTDGGRALLTRTGRRGCGAGSGPPPEDVPMWLVPGVPGTGRIWGDRVCVPAGHRSHTPGCGPTTHLQYVTRPGGATRGCFLAAPPLVGTDTGNNEGTVLPVTRRTGETAPERRCVPGTPSGEPFPRRGPPHAGPPAARRSARGTGVPARGGTGVPRPRARGSAPVRPGPPARGPACGTRTDRRAPPRLAGTYVRLPGVLTPGRGTAPGASSRARCPACPARPCSGRARRSRARG